jgi:hypothetical protein
LGETITDAMGLGFIHQSIITDMVRFIVVAIFLFLEFRDAFPVNTAKRIVISEEQ